MASLKYLAGVDLMTVTLASAYTAADGHMHLTGGHGTLLPAAGDFWLRTTSGTYRCFKVTARSTDDLTITAAQDGTSDGNLDAGAELKWALGATAFDQFRGDLMPTRAVMWHEESIVLTGNAIVVTHDPLENYGHFCQQTNAADGDTFTQSFILAAGTYTLFAVGQTSNAKGRIDWYIDDVKVVSLQDWYSSGAVYNVVKSAASITVSGSGRHVLKGVVNGKNGSSSNYWILLTKIWFAPASDVGAF